MRYAQDFARDIVLDLCIDTYVRRNASRTYASEIRKEVAEEILAKLEKDDILPSPTAVAEADEAGNSLLDLTTYSHLLCTLLNLKHFKRGELTARFSEAFKRILKSFDTPKKFYELEAILPFVYSPLVILNKYEVLNQFTKTPQQHGDEVIYSSQAAQFVPLKFAAVKTNGNFAEEWRQTIRSSLDELNATPLFELRRVTNYF